MKKILTIVAVVAALSGCWYMPLITGSGVLLERQELVRDFDSISVAGPFEVTLIQNETFSASVIADDNVLSHVLVRTNGSELIVGLDRAYSYSNVSLKLVVTAPAIAEIDLSGAATMTVVTGNGFPHVPKATIAVSGASHLLLPALTSDALSLEISGASTATIGMATSSGSIALSGASRLTLTGSAAGDVDLTVSGASEANLRAFYAGDLDVSVTGASEARVTMNGTLDAYIADASTLYYRGVVHLGSLSITGASNFVEY